jgi:O-antigen ligase
MVIALYAMIMTTLSITAIVVNIALWLFYLVMMKKLKWWSVFVIVLVVAICVSLFNYGLENPDAPILGDFSARVNEKLGDLERGDMGDFTTNRTDHAAEHFNYYADLPVLNLLLGGVPVNTRYIDSHFDAVAHNEYIDMLLNVGLVGAIVMFAYFIFNMVTYYKKYRASGDDKFLFLVMGKAVWAFYAASLTVFLDFRFMLLFLI